MRQRQLFCGDATTGAFQFRLPAWPTDEYPLICEEFMSKVWLITGSASGMGRSAVQTALERGDRVTATARELDRLSDLADEFPDSLKLFRLDVTDEAAARQAVNLTTKTFGRLDVLLNSAGYAHVSPFEQTSSEDFRAEIEANFYGVVNLTRSALPVMRLQRSGHIINISSSSARFGSPGATAYGAAKWAVSGFTASLSKEVRSFGVKAIAIEPGSMRTN